MEKCNKCGYEHWEFEGCLKTFYFKHESWGDDWEPIGACDYEDAAERVATKCNDEHRYMNEYVFENLPIADKNKESIKLFKVYAEPIVDYCVTEVEQEIDIINEIGEG